MTRVLLVEDSAVVRELLSAKLVEAGYEVATAADGVSGAEMALATPPQVVLTDLWMPGISGVQLCRLLRAEAATMHIPVVLVTGETDRRVRFWARCAGAAAVVGKAETDRLLEVLAKVTKETPTFPPDAPRDRAHGSIHERLSQRLDAALYESVILAEVRSLAQNEGDAERVFAGLARLASEVSGYRWLALATSQRKAAHASGAAHGSATGASSGSSVTPAQGATALDTSLAEPRLFVHAHTTTADACEAEARVALDVGPEVRATSVTDDRAVTGRASEPIVLPVSFGALHIAALALGPGPRGASSEDKKLVALIAAELAGALRIVTLVEEARQLAMTDSLTGLMNRRAFLEAMERERSRAKRHGHPLSVLVLDIDHFKRINDTRGHEAGDSVLKGISDAIRTVARRSDLVARWGGEEFVVGLPETTAAGARIAGERVRRAIADAIYPAPAGKPITATGSIGVATSEPNEALDALIARADRAMYAAKARGRNRVEC